MTCCIIGNHGKLRTLPQFAPAWLSTWDFACPPKADMVWPPSRYDCGSLQPTEEPAPCSPPPREKGIDGAGRMSARVVAAPALSPEGRNTNDLQDLLRRKGFRRAMRCAAAPEQDLLEAFSIRLLPNPPGSLPGGRCGFVGGPTSVRRKRSGCSTNKLRRAACNLALVENAKSRLSA